MVADVAGGAITVIERRDASKEVEDNGESVGRIFSKAGIGGPSKEVRRSMLCRSGDVEVSGGVGVEVSGGAGVEVLVVEWDIVREGPGPVSAVPCLKLAVAGSGESVRRRWSSTVVR